jgi:hypothetical protein
MADGLDGMRFDPNTWEDAGTTGARALQAHSGLDRLEDPFFLRWDDTRGRWPNPRLLLGALAHEPTEEAAAP